MADPKHPKHPKHSEPPEHFDNPASIPVLTDVLVPGRPPMPHRSEAQAPQASAMSPKSEKPTAPQKAPARAVPASEQAERQMTEDSMEAGRGAKQRDFVEAERALPTEPLEARRPWEPFERDESREPLSPAQPAELTERDVEHIAERLRARVAGYLREDGRRVIEQRCREALEEHTTWLVRQVTREVALALEGEVAGWVRDAVREELAVHQTAQTTRR